MKTILVCALLGAECWAQAPAVTPQLVLTPAQGELQGDRTFSEPVSPLDVPSFRDAIVPSTERQIPPPSSRSISVARLQHRVPKEADRRMARARKLSRANDHAGAARELEAAAHLDPSFAAAHHLLATEYGLLGRLPEAAAEFRRLLELEPENWIGHLGLGVALLQSGDFGGAEQSARRAVQLEPGNPTVNLVFGCALAARDDGRQEAVPYLRYAARTLPEARSFLQKLESESASGRQEP